MEAVVFGITDAAETGYNLDALGEEAGARRSTVTTTGFTDAAGSW
ncbi:hypothetical protein [Rathayibacter soli]|nr:hypothetical protein [Glaciibacter superstes]